VLFFINEKIQSKTNQGLTGMFFACAEMRLIGEKNSRSSGKRRKKRANIVLKIRQWFAKI
jgi:hypothetical protein